MTQQNTLRFWRAGIILALLLLFPAYIVQAQGQGDDPEQPEPTWIKAFLFYSPTCESCNDVRLNVIKKLYDEFGQQLQVKAIDITQEGNTEWWLACEKAYGVDQADADVPEVFIGDDYLVGAQQIEAQLRTLVLKYQDQGGVDFPDVPRPAGPLEPTVKFMYFYSETCPNCTYVKENVFPQLKGKYGARVQWESYDVQEQVNINALLILETLANIPPERQGGVPMLFIGDEYTLYGLFIGANQIPQYLEPTIDWLMEVGGAGFPIWKDELFQVAQPTPEAGTPLPTEQTPANEPTPTSQSATTPTDTATPVPQETSMPAKPAIHVAYFAEVGCSECDRVNNLLNYYIKNEYPNLVIHEFDITTPEGAGINSCLSERLNVPSDQRHDAPAIFVGSDFLFDTGITPDLLKETIAKYAETGAEPGWETCTTDERALPKPPTWWGVILPGLIDGINPCAFATIIFFISYLTLLERKGSEVMMVGIAFILAVFLSYLGFGMILREVLAGLIEKVGPILRTILNTLLAAACLVLAYLSFVDIGKARRGNVKGMALRLPDKLRKWINATIRRGMKSDQLVIASFVSGAIVSFIELACTGQVYVPIILGLSDPNYRLQSTIALIIYCLAFIIPLIVVFAISYTGTSSRQLGMFLNKHTPTVKLLTAILFLGIGGWLIYDLLRIWNLITPLSL